MTFGGNPFSTYACGLVIEVEMKFSSLLARYLSRSGPTEPCVPAAARVWQEPHATAPLALPFWKIAWPSAEAVAPAAPLAPVAPAAPPAAAPPAAGAGEAIFLTQVSHAVGSITWAVWRMK